MRLALAQINTTVGDLDGNRDRILGRLDESKGAGADLVLFPELVVTGYPPEDLLLRPSFVRAAERTLGEIARETRGIVALVGVPLLERDLFNACAVCAGGEVKARYRKRFLPNYGVFDEDRYFAPGDDLLLLEHGRTHEAGTQEQVLRRVPGDRELGEEDEVGVRVARLGEPAQDAVAVPLQVADDDVDLGECEPHVFAL